MASWTFDAPSNGYKFKVNLSQNAGTGAANTSTIGWDIDHYQEWTKYDGTMNRYLKIDTLDENYTVHSENNTYDTQPYGYQSWWNVSGANGTSGTVDHDANGNKTVRFTFYWSGSSGGFGPGTVNETRDFVLSRIAYPPQGLTQSVNTITADGAKFPLDISSRGNGTGAEHELQYKKASSGTWLGTPDQNITDTATNTFTLTGLDPATEYDYRHKAWNNNGDTSYSSSYSFTTLGYAAVSSFTLSATDTAISGNVQVDETCDLLEYKIDDGTYQTAFSGDFTDKDFTATEMLASDTEYDVQVRVRRKDSQLTTESSVVSVTTGKQNNFTGFGFRRFM